MTNNTIKKGDWFQFNDAIFKVYECPPDAIFKVYECPPDATMAYMYQMIYENGEYIEGEMYQFSLVFVHLYMKSYTPYREESDEEETI